MQSNIHFYVNWAKERLDEMDATLTSFENKVAEVQTDARDRANKVLSVMREKRDEFRNIVKKQAEANEAGWITAQAQLESEWGSFETEAKKYVESCPSSDDLRPIRYFENGGSGSSGVRV